MIKKSGFTLVELVIVITVIGVLSTIGILTLTRVTSEGRDKTRASDVSIIASALEKYYNLNGEYPSCNDISASAATVTANTLVGIDKDALTAPQAPSSETNSLKCQTLSSSTGNDFYQYQGDKTGSTPCTTFNIIYRDDTDGTLVTVASHH